MNGLVRLPDSNRVIFLAHIAAVTFSPDGELRWAEVILAGGTTLQITSATDTVILAGALRMWTAAPNPTPAPAPDSTPAPLDMVG